MPSIGGGTKLIRTLLAGEGEGVCSGVGDGIMIVLAKSKEILPRSAEGAGVGDSCAAAIAIKERCKKSKVENV